VAIITIPADFTQRFEAHEQSPITVQVNNLNLDFTNDIRRAVPDAITQFYRAQGSGSPVKVTMQEQDLRSRDIQLFEYSVLPTIVLLLTIAGVINGGVATSREWESRTIKELLLSPTPRSALVTGKVLANFLITFALGMAVLLVGDLLGWTQPQGIYWLSASLAIALVALMGSGLGVALGAALQRLQPTLALANIASIYLFFLAGGVSVLAFAPAWLQTIATFIPLSYGRHALEMAVFYSSSDLLGRDLLVLSASALVALALGALAMRRGIAS
jgi:ABC-2 type transport system permease protein